MPPIISLREAAAFYGCKQEDLEYYMKLGGPDPRRFIPYSQIDAGILKEAAVRAEMLVSIAENASCLENQPPSDFFPELCRKIITWQKAARMAQ